MQGSCLTSLIIYMSYEEEDTCHMRRRIHAGFMPNIAHHIHVI